MNNTTNNTSYFKSLKNGLKKTSSFLKNGLKGIIVSDKKRFSDEEIENLEQILIEADLGVDLSMSIIEEIADQKWTSETEVLDFMKQRLSREFLTVDRDITHQSFKPNIILFTGINGAGKTTSMSKVATYLQEKGHSVIFAAADTFRAAAIDQLTIWASRLGIPIVKHKMGADPAAVSYDAVESAYAKNIDYVLIDTAGRLHNQNHLMEELKKIIRVIKTKVNPQAIETLLVLDGNAGHNSFIQAKIFQETIGVDGIIITKLDGTAKGGVVVSVEKELKIPVKFIGVGEKQADLLSFNPLNFVDALFSD